MECDHSRAPVHNSYMPKLFSKDWGRPSRVIIKTYPEGHHKEVCVEFLGWALPGGGAGRCQILPLEKTCRPQQLLRSTLQSQNVRHKGSFHEATLITNARAGSPWIPIQDVRGRECFRNGGADSWTCEYGQDTDPWQTSQWSHQWKTKGLKLSLWFKDKNTYVVENSQLKSLAK